MKVVLQRVSKASVKVNNELVNSIEKGIVALIGFTINDSEDDIKYMVDKIKNIRIFDDQNGIMNKSLVDIDGEILSISQFTLYGDASKGRRPSYDKALKSEFAKPLYEKFNELLIKSDIKVKTGVFGADMKLELVNDGPVTIIIESRN